MQHQYPKSASDLLKGFSGGPLGLLVDYTAEFEQRGGRIVQGSAGRSYAVIPNFGRAYPLLCADFTQRHYPEGETYVATEAPLGVAGVFLVSRGEKTPWRLKLRTPSFNHVAALEPLLRGVGVDALEATLASVGYVVGDIDK